MNFLSLLFKKNINQKNKKGETPLMIASRKDNLKKVKILIDQGADVNVRDNDEKTPLMISSGKGYNEISKLLIDQGANLNLRNSSGETPLIVALKNEQKETAELLVANGADINARDNCGNSPVTLSLYQGFKELAESLISQGVDINVIDKDGNTPLTLALYQDFTEIAAQLISQDIDINMKNQRGSTPLKIALYKDFKEIVQLLIEKGIKEIEIKIPHGMAAIPAGSFMMGSIVGIPVRKVTLDAFYIDITEVTQADYEALMGINPSYFKGDSKRPVESVTWYDAILYCNERSKRDGLDPVYQYTNIVKEKGMCSYLENLTIDFNKNGYRLPTTAEWEYACRAGTTTTYYWGKNNFKISQYAWTAENSSGTTHPVGMKKSNAWGLYDMIGNVLEWCHDYYHLPTSKNPTRNPKGPDSPGYDNSRFLRGGSWARNQILDPYTSNCSLFTAVPGSYSNARGFRCVAVFY
jgi:formylglycine-generating enzyme required for sulfatase activity